MPVTLAQAVRSQGGGEPLPTVFPTLEHEGIRPRRGQVSMFFGYPGAGKTFLALVWACRLGIPTLYFSLDTDPGTMQVRAASIATGRDQDELERSGEDLAELAAGGQIRYSFLPDPDIESVGLEIAAYVEMFGTAPELIIVDNLLNVFSDSENEWAGMRSTMKIFHSMCRQSGSAIWILHHASEDNRNAYGCPARSAIQGKVSQLAELIISVGQRPMNGRMELGVCAVKNRRGKADPSGESALWMTTDLARMKIFETKRDAFADRYRQEIA